ncbi:MAG: HAMP domain-containing sensor histidine kinase [Nitrososphaeraceae archaeon]
MDKPSVPLQSSSSSDTSNGRTEVYYGTENVLNAELQFFANSKEKIDICMNYTRPQLAVEIEQIKKAFVDTKRSRRGIKFRYLTEITSENISFCKELISVVDEIRHIEGIKANFMISESEYLAPLILYRKGETASQIIYSNIKEVIEHQQYIFDSFWSKAVPAEQRIIEIEQGVQALETKVLEDKEKIFSHMKSVLENSRERSVCSSIGGMQLIYNRFFDEYKKIIERHKRGGEGRGVRWIISIDKDSIDLVKTFLKEGIQVRHIKNLTPMNFAVDSKHFHATIDKMQDGEIMQSLLVSNEPAYIRHYNSIFEELWKNGIDAIDRIKDIEAGVDLADIEVIPSSARAQNRYLNIVKTASKEILWIFPTTNAFIRQDKMGAIPLAIESARERNVKVRILVPASSILVKQKVQQLKQYSPPDNHNTIIDVRYIEQMSETKATILVVDRKASLVMELKDDTKSTFHGAIGLSTYSNSKAGVLSYVAIFENLWKQSELYQQLNELYEQLKIHDKMQREFINIAAHELRTPIQPILGITEILRSSTKDVEKARLLEVVIRSTKRLQQLTEDILDITKIESQSLKLNVEQFNLNDVITNAIDDITINKYFFKTENNKNNNHAIKLLYQAQDVFVEADKGRISQVIANLLDNAVKFTKEEGGTITVVVEKEEDDDKEHNNQHILVSIQDTGAGINQEILPRLFTKFATKSDTGGTGLGLFISKGIIEAHGGKIWAHNNGNNEEKGATFTFSLPTAVK